MTREERDNAIAILENEKKCVNRANKNDYCNRDCYNCELVKTDTEILTALDMAIKALEFIDKIEPMFGDMLDIPTQEPSGDLISRQAVQDYIAKYLSQYLYNDVREAVEVIDEYIGELPSVKPQEPKTGHWQHYEGMLICSECGAEFYDDIMEYCGDDVPKCCPDCGIRMVEEQESEDKCKNCEYYRNPDYTRCHECEAGRSDKG